jgi:PBP1b-binding outer membrane lipoprotein LpoB
MKKMKIWLSIFLLLFFFEACATKTYSEQERIFLVFKTSSIKYADLAFMYDGNEDIKIEMYSNGQALKALEIEDTTVCLSLFECLDKEAFNQKVLSAYYPKNILSHILRGEAIFASQNLVEEKNGFRQAIYEAGKYGIEYSVLGNKVVFHDRVNSITIKVKRLK